MTMVTEYTNNPLSNFLYALKAPDTKRQYPKRLEVFLDFVYEPNLSCEDKCLRFYNDTLKDTSWSQSKIIEFIIYQMKERVEKKKEISSSTVTNYVRAIKLFLEMNDIVSLNWKKINKGLPARREWADDRTPTRNEIKRLLEYPDQRIKGIVLTLLSSGCRLGLFDNFKWKHIKPIEKDGMILAAKITVYPGENEEYFSFITQEAYNELNKWMKFRQSYGEKITGESWVIRDVWRKTNLINAPNVGSINDPQPLKADAIKNKINKAWKIQHIRGDLREGERRHEFKNVHGFRKFFKTECEKAGMKTLHVEMLLGHSTGLNDNYYRPTEDELLNDYLKAVDLLTINEENRLSKEVLRLKEKNMNNEYIIEGKLKQKDDQIGKLEKEIQEIMKIVNDIVTNKKDIDEKNQIARNMIEKGIYLSK